MGMGQAIRTCFSKYVDFNGRAQRSEFWWWILGIWLISLVLSFVDSTLFGTVETTDTSFSASTDTPILSGIFGLAVLLPNLAVTARRLHDRNLSGWWMLAPYGAMLLALLMGIMNAGILAAASGLSAFVLVILLLVWLILKGTDGPNRFGPDPLGGSGGDHDGDYGGGDYTASRMPQVGRDE
jgi:uncharacterized membrane protein YhaH (DUF805 family)